MKTTTHAIAILLLTAGALGLSGCADSKPQPTPETPTTEPPVTSAAAKAPVAPAPVQPQPGPAHNGNYSFKSDTNIAPVTFQVNESWSKLHINLQMYKSAQCGILQAEPPAGTGTGPQPQVTFTSPSGAKFGPVPLGTYSSCDVSVHNKVGTTPAPSMVDAEKGAWKIDINGRGINMYLKVNVMGT